MDNKTTIADVSDTSYWVAHYRALETERPDALFKDPFAKVLVGERGRQIAEKMKLVGRYTQWSVVSRTVMIDDFINQLICDGVDTILNLGAGLDTRPYRMNLPIDLNWIEVDFAHIIKHKTELLKGAKPVCKLVQVELDLSDDKKRRQFLINVAPEAKSILVLTEGVIPYLTEQQVAALAEDLKAQPRIKYWINEYFTKRVYKYLKTSKREKMMKNSPFLFYPDNWIGFFDEHGWSQKAVQFTGDIAQKTGRKMPMPWWAPILLFFAPKRILEESKKSAGYQLLEKKFPLK